MSETDEKKVTALPSSAVGLLEELEQYSDEECQFDHNGGCQSHMYFGLGPGELCPHYEAYKLLQTVEADTDMEATPDTVPSNVRQLLVDLAGIDECEVEEYDGEEVCTSHSWSGDVPLEDCPNGNTQKFLESLSETEG